MIQHGYTELCQEQLYRQRRMVWCIVPGEGSRNNSSKNQIFAFLTIVELLSELQCSDSDCYLDQMTIFFKCLCPFLTCTSSWTSFAVFPLSLKLLNHSKLSAQWTFTSVHLVVNDAKLEICILYALFLLKILKLNCQSIMEYEWNFKLNCIHVENKCPFTNNWGFRNQVESLI